MIIFLQLIALIAVIAGTFFSLVGVLGLVRLPDVYTRLHATGKVGVFGVVFLSGGGGDLDAFGLGEGNSVDRTADDFRACGYARH